MRNCLILLICVSLSLASCARGNDVCIYGGSSACATAAYSAARLGSDVTVICPDVTIGGMTTGGLGRTDIGNKHAVVGLARQFYRKLGSYYGKLEQWLFEPHVAEDILMEYLEAPRIKVMQGWYLDSVEKNGTRIVSITCKNKEGQKTTIKADQFIDCSYEGDLMAMAGVSYIVGREGNEVYGETYDGVQMSIHHQFPDGVDPFIEKGKPESGLLWGISDWKLQETGSGDDYVQAYNYRICLTDVPENQIPIQKPDNYDPSMFELLVRVFEADPNPQLGNYFIWSMMPNHKTDINNRGPFSTDMIGMNHSYPDASWEEREKILKAHKDYTLGLFYFYMTDPRVPKNLQDEIRRWGLPKDEYLRTDHWTHQLYVREARRLVGEYVATQADCQNQTEVTDGIGFAAYQMDSHNCQRVVVEKDGKLMVKNEGDVERGGGRPYPISYRSLTPKREECENLLVPVCLSASHIAYGSIRMEPVFLGMGQSSGIAAAMAGKGAVQDVDVSKIQEIYATDPYLDGREPDTLIDEDSEYITGKEGWEVVNGRGAYGKTYLSYSGDPADNKLSYNIPEYLDGEYDVYSFQQRTGCPNMVFTIETDGKSFTKDFNRESLTVEGQTQGEWAHLGAFTFKKGSTGSIRFSGDGPDVRADAILFVKK
ncbi:MAG: FAD-dependent oxidoreductase [Bacteroidales bacterium]|nr:FAD-dependent oxidoreductase [Bacteroidales bacterium]